MSTDEVAICDALVLAQLVAENAYLRGDGASKISAELERLWLEFAFLDDSGGNMDLRRRVPAEDEPALVAELEAARNQLMRVEAEASTAVGNARGAVAMAQSRIDAFRRDLVGQHAQIWRQHAEELRRRAAAVGDETVTVTVHVFSPDGARTEPRLEYLRNVLADDAVRADGTAAQLEGRLSAGDEVNSGEALALLVSQLEQLPEAAEAVSAV